MRNNRDRYGHVYIFLIRKQKLSDLCPYVCLSVRTIQSYFNTNVELLKRQLAITDINFRRIHEGNRK